LIEGADVAEDLLRGRRQVERETGDAGEESGHA
jgi:hypothetical protein